MFSEEESAELVTVGTYPTYIWAHLGRLRVEAEGLQAIVEDEHLTLWKPLHDVAIHGVKLRVLTSDRVEALRILQAQREALAVIPMHCPRCKSEDVVRGLHPAFLAVLIIGLPLAHPRRWVRCQACKHAWRENP